MQRRQKHPRGRYENALFKRAFRERGQCNVAARGNVVHSCLLYTSDLHSEDAPGNIQSEHEVMFTAEGIKTKAIIARWNGEPETSEKISTEQAEKVENTAE